MISAALSRRRLGASLLAAAALAACASQPALAPTPEQNARVVGYYSGGTARRGFPVSSVNGALLTHINYAFGRVQEDGTAALANAALDSANFVALAELKQRYPHLQVLISFGGWTGSRYFSNAAVSAEARARFVQGVLDIFFRPFPGVFDGVDLDWEYPVRGGPEGMINRPEDRQNLTALVAELRRALDAESGGRKHYLITIAAPAGAGHLDKYDVKELAAALDFINLMTYDFHSSGSRIAHFNSPLGAAAGDADRDYNIERSVAAWLGAGVPRDRLLVGVPFYGHGFAPVSGEKHGLFQAVGARDTAAGAARRKWTGAVRFYDIKNVLADGFERHWEKSAKVPWLYNPATATFVSYDDAQSIGEKAKFVRKQKLGGIMIWELSGDDGTLLPTIQQQLRR